jgi:glycosyltransferase involved in cell wall biosynthesis
MQKGYLEFIKAVNFLGEDFKNQNDVEYFLYGRGEINSYVDLSLFNNPEFLEGEELYKAYSQMDIVVMPSRYEPFGLTGLEAMASGNLLLATSGLGMDSYMNPEKNCLAIPQDYKVISEVLKNALKD